MKIRITIPSEFYDKACIIMRAIDPDIGGYLSFGEFDIEKTTYTVDMPCSELCYELSNNADLLYEYIKKDYDSRWSEFASPTLSDVFEFCSYIEHVNEDIDVNGEVL
jgi:hypothetical protein